MRVLIGVESVEGAREVAGWMASFGFTALEQEWLHIVAENKSTVWALDPFLAAGESARLQEQAASKMERALKASSGVASVRVRIGNPTVELLNRADTTGADLIAVRGSNKSGLATFFLGSVARALVEGASQSVLLTRGEVPQVPLRLLVASDHSEYMEQALTKLTSWAPQGIGALTLLHVSPTESPLAAEATETAAQALGEKLGLPASVIHSRVTHGSVSQAIDVALAETGADLLVLGAKGQTLLERLTLGSVSFRAVTTCPKSVLVLRV